MASEIEILRNDELKEPIQFIKYMGSKTKIIDNVIDVINSVSNNGPLCDLFSGSCTLSNELGNQREIITNDIQNYSSILGYAYLLDWNDGSLTDVSELLDDANNYYDKEYSNLISDLQYKNDLSLKEFNIIEKLNQKLISKDFSNQYHLFTKFYSGTWWSAEQCAWIDSIKMSIDKYKDTNIYNTLMASLMFAMAYTSQGTGHYAQYRDAKTISSKNDIMIYRQKKLPDIFKKKTILALNNLSDVNARFDHRVFNLDYIDCLNRIPTSTIYADPPYCFVHYSRFYHAIETLTLYDYPEIQFKNGKMVKGRYRLERHQSPFSIKSKVTKAFSDLFDLTLKTKSNLVLSYSNTGMISLDDIMAMIKKKSAGYSSDIITIDHTHMTMGRKNDRSRDIKEAIIYLKRK
jgi:adenine-specific DNA-methyltransferase